MSGTPVAIDVGAQPGGIMAGILTRTPGQVLLTNVEVRRHAEARIACLALGTAAVLSLIRATVLPFVLAAAPQEQFASFVSPEVRLAHWLLVGVFVAACLFARRNPLHATLAALVLFLIWAVPDFLRNPVLVGGGHIGKLVTLGVLARAAFAGVMHRLLQYERA